MSLSEKLYVPSNVPAFALTAIIKFLENVDEFGAVFAIAADGYISVLLLHVGST